MCATDIKHLLMQFFSRCRPIVGAPSSSTASLEALWDFTMGSLSICSLLPYSPLRRKPNLPANTAPNTRQPGSRMDHGYNCAAAAHGLIKKALARCRQAGVWACMEMDTADCWGPRKRGGMITLFSSHATIYLIPNWAPPA